MKCEGVSVVQTSQCLWNIRKKDRRSGISLTPADFSHLRSPLLLQIPPDLSCLLINRAHL